MGMWDYGAVSGDEVSSRQNSVRMANNTNSRTVDWLYHNSDEESYVESSIDSDGTNDEYLNKYKTYPRCYSRRESTVSNNLNNTMPVTGAEQDLISARLSKASMSSNRKSANTMYLYFPKPFSRAGFRMSSMIKSNKNKSRCIKRNKIFKPKMASKIRKPMSSKIKWFFIILLFIILLLVAIPACIYLMGNISEMVVESKFRPIPGLYDPRSILGKNRIQSIQIVRAGPA